MSIERPETTKGFLVIAAAAALAAMVVLPLIEWALEKFGLSAAVAGVIKFPKAA